jgi:hypothetical protein
MAQKQLYINNGESVVGVDLAMAAVSLTLATGDGPKFPAVPDPLVDFYLVTLTDGPNETLWEIVKVTDRTGDVLTIERAQEGTLDLAWPAVFTNVSLRETKETLERFMNKEEANTEWIETVSSAANVLDLDLSHSNNFATTLTENITTVNFNNVPAGPALVPFTIEIIQGAGPFAITWPAAVKWPGASAPTLSAGPADVDVIAGYTRDGGTNIRLAFSMEDSS